MLVITLARNGRQIPIGKYVTIINRVKASPTGTLYKKSFANWYTSTREDILREFGQMVTDKINEHLTIRTLTEGRLHRKMCKHLVSKCRRCGHSLGEYKNEHSRFCDSSCRRDYYF